MKRFPSLLLALTLLVGLLTAPVYAASSIVSPPDADHGVYYVDDAQCLSSTTKDYINRQNIALTNACGGQVAVVTLEFLNDLNTEEYAYEVMNQWGVGDKKANNGTVFVLVTAEKKCWITSGSGIEDDLSAGVLENILGNYCYDSLDSGRYDAAVYDTVQAIFAWYESYYNMSLSSYSSTQVQQNRQAGFGGGAAAVVHEVGSIIQNILGTIFTLIVVVLVIFAFTNAMRHPGFWCFGGPSWCFGPPRGRGPRGPGGFGGPGFGGGGGFGGGAGRGGGFGGFGGGGFGGGGGHGGGAGRR